MFARMLATCKARIDAYMCSRLVLDAVSDSEMVALSQKQHLE